MIGRKIIEAVNVILSIDDAIDSQQSDYAAYKKDGSYDESKLKFLDGKKPTRFRLKQWTRRQRNDFVDNAGTSASIDLALRYTLVHVDNYMLDDAVLAITEDDFDSSPVHGRILKQEWLDKANMTIAVRRELFEHIHAVGELSLPL